jgi:hypothetical protein
MIPFVTLWSRRLWPYVTLAGIAAALMLAIAGARGRHGVAALEAAHQATVTAAAVTAAAETVFVHDTVPLRAARASYREARDSAIAHPVDVARATQAFAQADNALALDSTAIASAARSITAHVVLEGALRTELAIAMRLRAPRYRLSSTAGVDVGSGVPITGLETSVRLSEHWAVVGRLEKRWETGSPTRRYVVAQYTF